MNRVDTTEPLEPSTTCATSPSFVNVTVAAGASTIVLVIVIGDPTLLVPEDDMEVEATPGVAVSMAADVVSREVPTIEAFRMRMHPFGEHMSFFGQHPPPASAGHSTRDARHFGGRDSEA